MCNTQIRYVDTRAFSFYQRTTPTSCLDKPLRDINDFADFFPPATVSRPTFALADDNDSAWANIETQPANEEIRDEQDDYSGLDESAKPAIVKEQSTTNSNCDKRGTTCADDYSLSEAAIKGHNWSAQCCFIQRGIASCGGVLGFTLLYHHSALLLDA